MCLLDYYLISRILQTVINLGNVDVYSMHIQAVDH